MSSITKLAIVTDTVEPIGPAGRQHYGTGDTSHINTDPVKK